MKYIRKIFHPLVPFLVLLLIFAKMSYNHFLKLEDFTEEESHLLLANFQQLRDIQKKYTDKHTYYLMYFPTVNGGFCSAYHSDIETKNKIDSLEEIYETYSITLKNEVLNADTEYITYNKNIFGNQYRMNGKIVSFFDNYISEIRKVDSTLYLYYKNYKFNNKISENEVQRLYVSKNKQELRYLLVSFETELAQIYNNAVVELVSQKVYFPETEYIRKQSRLIPMLSTEDDSFEVDIAILFPFDTANTKVVEPKNGKYYFSKDNYYMIFQDFDKHNMIGVETIFRDSCDNYFWVSK